jgi:hypothetical protein
VPNYRQQPEYRRRGCEQRKSFVCGFIALRFSFGVESDFLERDDSIDDNQRARIGKRAGEMLRTTHKLSGVGANRQGMRAFSSPWVEGD